MWIEHKSEKKCDQKKCLFRVFPKKICGFFAVLVLYVYGICIDLWKNLWIDLCNSNIKMNAMK